MKLLERFRRKPLQEIRISEELVTQVTEKLLEDLNSGFIFEDRYIEFNDEDLDKLEEFGYEDEIEEDKEAELTGLTEGMRAILKDKGKYYLITIWRKESIHRWPQNNGLHAEEIKTIGDYNYKRAVFFSPGKVDARVTEEWISLDGNSSSWSSLDASSQQTLDLFRDLMSAKVDVAATRQLFTQKQEEIKRYNWKNRVVRWPDQI